jgi:hypothetical protein
MASASDATFQGYMISAGKPLFVISTVTGKTSGWLSVGQTFDGFLISGFDEENQTLALEKDGKRQDFQLASGRVTTVSEGATSSRSMPIVIVIGNGEQISVGNDAGMINALKKKFEAIAQTVPQPKVTLRPPQGSTIDSLKLVMDACREAGIKRFDISM